MAMEINSVYRNYTDNYTNFVNNKKQTTEETEIKKEIVGTDSAVRKTSADELSYLSNKYNNYSFIAADYTKGMQYGSSSTVNVAISPQFLAKMANDPALEKEYEENIAAMQACDEQFTQMQAAGGWRVEAQGWAIDKDGGISSWAIVTKDPNSKSYLQKMSESAEKIQDRKDEEKKQKEKIDEKRQAGREEKAELKEQMKKAGKEQFGNKFKDAIVTARDEKNVMISRETETVAGLNMDIKA